MGSWAKREDTQKKQTNGETKTNEHPATPNKSKSETDRKQADYEEEDSIQRPAWVANDWQ